MNILDYLPQEIADDQASENKYVVNINDIPQDQNPFHIRFDRKLRNYQLSIQPMSRWMDDDEKPDGNWMNADSAIEFKMVAYTEPTIERFSQHIYDELHCAFNSYDINTPYLNDWKVELDIDHNTLSIDVQHVYKFMKELHKDYTNTETFLKDYEVYRERLYHDFKFANALAFGQDYMFARCFSMPIGVLFFDFMDIEITN